MDSSNASINHVFVSTNISTNRGMVDLFPKAMLTSSLLHNKADLQCHVTRLTNFSLTKDGTRGRNRAYPVKE
jgi:hypothetical protein